MTAPNGFPGIHAIEDLHVSDDGTTRRDPVIVTWRVVIRDTGRVLRRGFESTARFAVAEHFPDQLAEFPTKDAAECAIWTIRDRKMFNEMVALESREFFHAGLSGHQLNAVLCKVRDTAIEQAYADMGLTHPTLRGLAGLATKGGW